MKYTFIKAVSLVFLLMVGTICCLYAQDSLKKTIKKPAAKPAAIKPLPIDPVTGKPKIPINPKTGRPYSIYHGYVSNPKYAATYKAGVTDTAKKAPAAAATTAPVVTTPPPADKTLNGQYQYLLTKVYNYQQPFVTALWKNVVDSLNADKHQLNDARAKIAEQTKTITALQAPKPVEALSPADEISWLGIAMSKTLYNVLMWGLVIVLAVIAAVVVASSGRYRHEANYRTGLYTELEEEYKNYKAKANAKEKKLARDLQTERNKVDELMGKG